MVSVRLRPHRGLTLPAVVIAWLVFILQANAAGVMQRTTPRNFLWRVNGRQGAVYLVGSIHLLSSDFYPLSPALETAYKTSDILVEEVDLGEMSGGAQFALLQKGMLSSEQPLDRLISPSTMAALEKRADSIGLPMAALKMFKPWMIALTIEQTEWLKAGFDPDLGLDKHFYDQAKTDGKKVEGLETVDYQIARFDEMPMELQDHLLAETLKDIDDERANMSKLTEAWRAGDAGTVERVVLKDLQQEAALYKRLLVERNRNWMPKLDALLARKGDAMVVVGAAHLVGPDGLLTMLKAKGYRVEQL